MHRRGCGPGSRSEGDGNAVSLHGLTSITLGVPDVGAVASYYEDFGLHRVGGPLVPGELGAPLLAPPQVFGIGLNYREHAAESGVAAPDVPPVFTKFRSCLAGPSATIELPSDHVDWEVELVAVIGRAAERVPEEKAWSHVAGVMVGQDLSERTVQLAGPVPQFSLG